MSTNARENWQHTYAERGVTYAADPRNPVDLEQLWHYGVVHGYIVTYLPDAKAPEILETGCGGARNALYLSLQGYSVTCADYSEEAIRLARANFKALGAKGTFLVDDLLNSTIPDNAFDCIMSFGLLEHFADLGPLVQSLTRVVKPGGIHIHLVIPKKFSTQTVTNLFAFPFKLANNLIVRRQPLRGILQRSYRNFPHYENSYSWREYCAKFEKCGNEILKCEPGGLILPFVYWPTYLGLGYAVVKLLREPILKANNWVGRSTSPAIYLLSQTFTVIARKR
jgi:SAM-dependent methyltransferase